MKTPSQGLEALAKMEYPGRLIIIGRDSAGEHNLVVYAITGRSPASQARGLVRVGEDTIKTQITDRAVLRTGNESLLIYNCIRRVRRDLAVSNGAQTDLIAKTMQDLRDRKVSTSPVDILAKTFGRPHLMAPTREGEGIDLSSYEPDAPNFTPRISGCVMNGAALIIVKRGPDGSALRRHFEVPLVPGKGKLIATYSGENTDPLPSFRGRPLDVELIGKTAEEVAETVYESMAPQGPGRDFRVGLVVIFAPTRSSPWKVAIIDKSAGQG